MSHHVVTPGTNLAERASAAIADVDLQHALRNLDRRLFTARDVADDFPELKERAAALRRETLADLPRWLDQVERVLAGVGVRVHRAATPADARRIILGIGRDERVTRAVKSKSMATEEIDLADALEAAGIETVETDLGEYIVQVAGERPSHMIVPAIHKTLAQVADVLETRADAPLPVEHEAITAWARAHLRPRFLAADFGITGANFVAADTGTIVLVTNEGNGDLCTIIPRVQVAVVPVEKVVARFGDLATLLPLLTMSATGQRISNYVTMINGPRRAGEIDGPEVLHVVLLDHGRLRLVGTAYEDMLACIRCGACLNVCPVFRRISGHAYDAVYSGPMGKVLTPLLSSDGSDGRELPEASTLCGACTEACPVEIPLADLLVRLRADLRRPGAVDPLRTNLTAATAPAEHPRRPGEGYASRVLQTRLASRTAPRTVRGVAFATWARLWASPAAYSASSRAARLLTRLIGDGGRGPGRRILPGARTWTATRDLPRPAARPFRTRWEARARGNEQW
ncbi:MAG: LUD domain-containing protein [Acidimicrobiia bacterium]